MSSRPRVVGRLDSNQRPTDYESGLNTMPLTCADVTLLSLRIHGELDPNGPSATGVDTKGGTNVEQIRL